MDVAAQVGPGTSTAIALLSRFVPQRIPRVRTKVLSSQVERPIEYVVEEIEALFVSRLHDHRFEQVKVGALGKV